MTDWAYVTHPVTKGTARIARQSLAHYLRCGWTETAAPERVLPETDEPPAGPSPENVPPPGGPQETGE